MDAQQELYTEMLTALWARFGRTNVHDGPLPPDGTPYPFVYLGDTTDTDDFSIKAVPGAWGRSTIRIHVWSDKPTQRGSLSAMINRVKNVCRRIESTDSYAWELVSLTENILPDNTTKTPLLHGVIDATYRHY